MAKPKPKRIPSDSCRLFVDGEECYPHEGEWVELISAETMGELRVRVKFARLGVALEAIQGEADEVARANALLEEHYGEVCEHLARRVFAWNWTDDLGTPLPQPRGNPEAFRLLRSGELHWLMNAMMPRETADERKNA